LRIKSFASFDLKMWKSLRFRRR